MAFYKLDGETLLEAPNFVLNKDYELYVADKETYQYPIDGWYWFDSEEEAKQFFNIV